MVYSVPIDLIIEKMEYKASRDTRRVQDNKKQVKQKFRRKRGNFLGFTAGISIPFFLIALMILGIWGWLL